MDRAVTAARTLVAALRDPVSVASLDADGWSALLSVARAEVLLGTLACRLDGMDLPDAVAPLMASARTSTAQAQVHALWEAEMCRRALEPCGIAPILLKGTAYAAAGLDAAAGRQIGDLDILVPQDRLDDAEGALIAAEWEWVKDDPYDQDYYRRRMHELPPLIHRERDRMIDVHHDILPRTHRSRPDVAALLADAADLPGAAAGLRILSPVDLICHAAAHLIADGDMAGGLRNLWDMDRLFRRFAADDAAFWPALDDRARRHGLSGAVRRAARLAGALYATPLPQEWRVGGGAADRLFLRRVLARDGWGRDIRPVTRGAFYIRSHWMRMPPTMLARHLWIKARRR